MNKMYVTLTQKTSNVFNKTTLVVVEPKNLEANLQRINVGVQ